MWAKVELGIGMDWYRSCYGGWDWAPHGGPTNLFPLPSGAHCYVWVGLHASEGEKKNGFAYASTYLANSKNPFVPISVLVQENDMETKQDTLGKK